MIIADTGFWVALFNASDHDHEPCKSFLAGCREPLITTTPVLTETTHLLIQGIENIASFGSMLGFVSLVPT